MIISSSCICILILDANLWQKTTSFAFSSVSMYLLIQSVWNNRTVMSVSLKVKLPSSFIADLKEIIVFVKTDVFYFSVLDKLDKSNERGLRRHPVKCFKIKSSIKVKSKFCTSPITYMAAITI